MIVKRETLADPVASTFITKRPGDPCFYCGEPLCLPYQLWSGADGTRVGLHVGCSRKLADTFLKDAAAAELPDA